MIWKATIHKIDNGYLLEFKSAGEPVRRIPIEIKESFNPDKEFYYEAEALSRAFKEVQDYFGVFNSKHEDYMLNINVVKQRK